MLPRKISHPYTLSIPVNKIPNEGSAPFSGAYSGHPGDRHKVKSESEGLGEDKAVIRNGRNGKISQYKQETKRTTDQSRRHSSTKVEKFTSKSHKVDATCLIMDTNPCLMPALTLILILYTALTVLTVPHLIVLMVMFTFLLSLNPM